MSQFEIQDHSAAAFARWLRERVQEGSWSITALAKASSVSAMSLRRATGEYARLLQERNTRRLAAFFGWDPDEIAALAGYADLRIAGQDPREFESIADWLRASLAARNEAVTHAAVGAGLGLATLYFILDGTTPERPTLDALAGYFRVSRAELRALRPKMTAYVASGQRLMSSLGSECNKEILAAARAKLTAEDRRANGKQGGAVGGAITRRRQHPEDIRALQDASAAVRKERGYHFASEESRLSFREKTSGAIGRERALRAWQTKRALYGEDFGHQAAVRRFASVPKKGTWHPCVFCHDQARLLYWHAAEKRRRVRGPYHRGCWFKWLRTDEGKDWFHKFGIVNWVSRQIERCTDDAVKKRVRKQIAVQHDHLRRPRRRRPPTLLRDVLLWSEALRLYEQEGWTTQKIGEHFGWNSKYRDDTGHQGVHRWAWEMIRTGKAIRDSRSQT